jgi:hypothetical protein
VDTALSQLNNRDIALLAWIAVIVIALFVYPGTRKSLCSLLKLVFLTKIAIGVLAVLTYVAIIVLAARGLGIWQWWMLKDTIWWFFGTALVVLFNINKSTEEEHYFRSIVFAALKFSVVLGFILNLYAFNLVIEILLVPVLALLAMLVVVAGTSKKYAEVKKLLDGVTALIGFTLAAYVLSRALADFHGFATLRTLEDFLLPLALTITVVPIVYAIALYGAYESLFVQIGFRIRRNEALYGYAKRQVFRACRLRLSNVNRFSKDFVHKLGGVQSQAEVATLTTSFKEGRTAKVLT